MPTKTESLRCQMVSNTSEECYVRCNYEDGQWTCITQHPGVDELLSPADLEVILKNFQCYQSKSYYLFGLISNVYSRYSLYLFCLKASGNHNGNIRYCTCTVICTRLIELWYLNNPISCQEKK